MYSKKIVTIIKTTEHIFEIVNFKTTLDKNYRLLSSSSTDFISFSRSVVSIASKFLFSGKTAGCSRVASFWFVSAIFSISSLLAEIDKEESFFVSASYAQIPLSHHVLFLFVRMNCQL